MFRARRPNLYIMWFLFWEKLQCFLNIFFRPDPTYQGWPPRSAKKVFSGSPGESGSQGRMEEASIKIDPVDELPGAALRDSHTLGSPRQPRRVLSQCWRSGVQHQGVGRAGSLWRLRGRICPAPLSEPLAVVSGPGRSDLWTLPSDPCSVFIFSSGVPCLCLRSPFSYKDASCWI